MTTTLDQDNTGWAHLTGLQPEMTYYYAVVTGAAQTRPHAELVGSFNTFPSADSYRHPVHNPAGLFNFSFEYACANQQRDGGVASLRRLQSS